MAGKKYLLYIHHDRFLTEANKSALVNKLLADHYDLDKRGDNTVSVVSIRPDPTDELSLDDLESVCEHGREKGECPNMSCPYNLSNL